MSSKELIAEGDCAELLRDNALYLGHMLTVKYVDEL